MSLFAKMDKNWMALWNRTFPNESRQTETVRYFAPRVSVLFTVCKQRLDSKLKEPGKFTTRILLKKRSQEGSNETPV